MKKLLKTLWTIDFETTSIERRPRYPPAPVGVSIIPPGKKTGRYYAWGHPTDNNCDKADAVRALGQVYSDPNASMLFHNSKFDIDVAHTHLGLAVPSWERIHDTLFLLALIEPHADTHSLKPSAERWLDLPPTERDAVADWLLDNGVITKAQRKGKGCGAFISWAPGGLVGKYANGDTLRTRLLFEKIYPLVAEAGMVPAYNRERELMPILLKNEGEGIRVDVDNMRIHLPAYESAIIKVDAYIAKRLKVKGLNVDSDAELAEALDAAGIISDWEYTATGKRSTSKQTMTSDKFKCQKIANALGYRNRLKTCLSTFMAPWLLQAEQTGGVIHTNWNQTRQGYGGGDVGARTGRLSSSPNFQNIPKGFEDRGDGYKHPAFLDVMPLPLMRQYLLPDKGHTWIKRDYSQQELRILAHFEDGELLEQYNLNPKLDMHVYVAERIHEQFGLKLSRSDVKTINFGIIYGMGAPGLAGKLGMTVQEAQEAKKAHGAAIPGLANLERDTRRIGKCGEFITTWGGRRYYVEPSKMVEGRLRSFEYKLLNYLIQGSAADCSKQSIINYHNHPKREGRFLATVHDENNASVAPKRVVHEMAVMRECMLDVNFDVPMLSDGDTGPNWGSLKKFSEK